MAVEAFATCCFYLLAMSVPLLIFVIAIIAGQVIERKHLKELDRREAALVGRILIHNRKTPFMSDPTRAEMVAGEVVIGADRFKTWLAHWRQIIGGRMGSLAPVVDRARREAHLRAVEKALSKGYKEVGNIRYTTANMKMGDRNQKELLLSVTVYGTAYS